MDNEKTRVDVRYMMPVFVPYVLVASFPVAKYYVK